jgi:hypothetical protein
LDALLRFAESGKLSSCLRALPGIARAAGHDDALVFLRKAMPWVLGDLDCLASEQLCQVLGWLGPSAQEFQEEIMKALTDALTFDAYSAVSVKALKAADALTCVFPEVSVKFLWTIWNFVISLIRSGQRHKGDIARVLASLVQHQALANDVVVAALEFFPSVYDLQLLEELVETLVEACHLEFVDLAPIIAEFVKCVDYCHSLLCRILSPSEDEWEEESPTDLESNILSQLMSMFSVLIRRERDVMIQLSLENWMDGSRYPLAGFGAFVVNVWSELLMCEASACSGLLMEKLNGVLKSGNETAARQIAIHGLVNFFLSHPQELEVASQFVCDLLESTNCEREKRNSLIKLLACYDLPAELTMKALGAALQGEPSLSSKSLRYLWAIAEKCSRVDELKEMLENVVHLIILVVQKCLSEEDISKWTVAAENGAFQAEWTFPIRDALQESFQNRARDSS